MRISDTERQAFAQALRDLADGNGGELLDRVNRLRVDEVGDYTLFGIGAVLAMDKAGSCDAEDASGYLAALADLVDRPTCDVRMGVTGHVGVCTCCGAMVEMRAAVFDAIEALPTRYCPNCGAEVNDGVD